MASTGTRLREERETRGVSLAQIAEATGVSPVYLEAMESGTFDRLPGRAFGKLYIRAYAEVLAFDPRPVLEMYDNERRPDRVTETTRPAPAGSRPVAEAIARWKAAQSDLETGELEEEAVVEPVPAVVDAELETAAPGPVVEVEPVEPPGTPTAPKPTPPPPIQPPQPALPLYRRRPVALAAALVVVAAMALIWGMREPARPVPEEAVQETVQEPVSTASPLPPSPPPPSPPAPAVTTPRRESRPVPKPSGPASDLSISEYGLGRRVVSSRLQGESDRFTEGDVVTFQTRVLGGKRGDAIRHVWIFEGRAQQSIPLRVNDADWRTHSAKTIYKAGAWTVEARDTSGRVLATASFTCAAK